MGQLEITSDLNLSLKEKELLDMHSFLNIMNVLIGENYVFQLTYGEQAGFAKAMEIAEKIKDDLGDMSSLKMHINNVEDLRIQLLDNINDGLDMAKADKKNPEVVESLDNINSVFDIMKVRAMEILARLEEPDKWFAHNIKDLSQNFVNVLAAIEKNSKGKYAIVYNIASKDPEDYIVDLNIESVDGDVIYMPSVMQDVLRDIIANARKYSEPGGRISAGLHDDGEYLRIVVRDEGRGIPENELESVVNYGERASNIGNTKTMGGGFGLTKAYFMTKQFGGKMWIASDLGKGTTVTIQIPIKIGGDRV